MTDRRRRRRPTLAKPARPVVALTAAEFRALIQKFVDRARKEQFIADRLAEEARKRFGAEFGVPKETE